MHLGCKRCYKCPLPPAAVKEDFHATLSAPLLHIYHGVMGWGGEGGLQGTPGLAVKSADGVAGEGRLGRLRLEADSAVRWAAMSHPSGKYGSRDSSVYEDQASEDSPSEKEGTQAERDGWGEQEHNQHARLFPERASCNMPSIPDAGRCHHSVTMLSSSWSLTVRVYPQIKTKCIGQK